VASSAQAWVPATTRPEAEAIPAVRTSLPLCASTLTTEANWEAGAGAGVPLSATRAGSNQQPAIKQKRMSLF
jgi:hypothetical protein